MFGDKSKERKRSKAFTLIELLIVVAIIAILASIAVPNFLEAQTRAKASRVKSDMRTLATAMESFRVTFGQYPPDALETPWRQTEIETLVPLTTPISYISSVPEDIFQDVDEVEYWGYFYYYREPRSLQLPRDEDGIRYYWFLYSVGPDQEEDDMHEHAVTNRYDPTNGTISDGDIGRWGP